MEWSQRRKIALRILSFAGVLDTLRGLPGLWGWLLAGVNVVIGVLVIIWAWVEPLPPPVAFVLGLASVALLFALTPTFVDGVRWVSVRVTSRPTRTSDDARVPTDHRTLTVDDEASTVLTIRRNAGFLAERLGDRGSVLSKEEEVRVDESFTTLRDALYQLAHHEQLRRMLREFIDAASWMCRYKSDLVYGGRRTTSTRQEDEDARRDLERAFRGVVEACDQVLQPSSGIETAGRWISDNILTWERRFEFSDRPGHFIVTAEIRTTKRLQPIKLRIYLSARAGEAGAYRDRSTFGVERLKTTTVNNGTCVEVEGGVELDIGSTLIVDVLTAATDLEVQDIKRWVEK